MIALFPHPVCEAKAIKDLEASALKAICLSVEDFRASLVYYACFDA